MLVAAVLAVGGLKPAAPLPGAGESPDYIAFVESLRFGVEVKRPESYARLLDNVDKAIDQISAIGSEAGLIVVDLSDCLFEEGRQVWLTRDAIQPTFRAACKLISDHIETSDRAGTDRISNLFAFTNRFAWTPASPPSPAPLFLMYSEVFREARAGLIVEYSRRFREQIDQGYQAFGGQIIDRQRVSWR